MSKEVDHKVPVGVSLPQSMIQQIDQERGQVPRSAYILNILTKAFKRRKTKVA
jgi:metal-responsive CopG/Arc/MetJ family transcriptional regulator